MTVAELRKKLEKYAETNEVIFTMKDKDGFNLFEADDIKTRVIYEIDGTNRPVTEIEIC